MRSGSERWGSGGLLTGRLCCPRFPWRFIDTWRDVHRAAADVHLWCGNWFGKLFTEIIFLMIEGYIILLYIILYMILKVYQILGLSLCSCNSRWRAETLFNNVFMIMVLVSLAGNTEWWINNDSGNTNKTSWFFSHWFMWIHISVSG